MGKKKKVLSSPAVDLLEFKRLAQSPKTLLVDGDWVRSPHKNSTKLTLFCAVVIGGVVVPGVRVQINALREYPDKDVTIQLEFGSVIRTRIPICRCDWRPFRTHSNGNLGPQDLRHIDLETHWHPFDLNAESIGHDAFAPDDSLPLALPILPEPGTVEEALLIAGKLLNIENTSEIPVPPWQYEMNMQNRR